MLSGSQLFLTPSSRFVTTCDGDANATTKSAIDDHYLMGSAADELFFDWESQIDNHYLMSNAADELLSEE